MKKLLLVLYIAPTLFYAQQSYYDDVDLTLTGQALYDELQQKVAVFNENYTYGEFRDSLIFTDNNPQNSTEVVLTYGFNDTDGDCTTDRTRDNELFGGAVCEFNREHVFARSLADPPMGPAENDLTGIVADPHNLRATDVQRNGIRGSRLFDDATGNSRVLGNGNWYPGDEWKGDVARVIMFMFLRYEDRCLPTLTGTGAFEGDTEMLQLFLEWNAEDPVSDIEEQRNPQLEIEYGSRNPFIDNPALATVIWGGTPAEDIWGILLSTEAFDPFSFSISPNPAQDFVTITTTSPVQEITIYDIIGRVIYNTKNSSLSTTITIGTQDIPNGIYLVEIDDTVQRLIVQ